MDKISIDKYRIIPAPATGIGWVSVEAWNGIAGAYRHVSTHRSTEEANIFITNMKNGKN